MQRICLHLTTTIIYKASKTRHAFSIRLKLCDIEAVRDNILFENTKNDYTFIT